MNLVGPILLIRAILHAKVSLHMVPGVVMSEHVVVTLLGRDYPKITVSKNTALSCNLHSTFADSINLIIQLHKDYCND